MTIPPDEHDEDLYGYDANGNVGQMLDADDGSLKAHYGPDPFGSSLVVVGEEAEGNPFRFSTKYCDRETSLCYYGLRFYSPPPGRFINRDPVAERGVLLLYALGRNNPIDRLDPLGFADCTPWLWIGFEWIPTGETRDVEYAVALAALLQILDPTQFSSLAGTFYRGDREAEDELNRKHYRVCIECSWHGLRTYDETRLEPTGTKRWRHVMTLYYRNEPDIPGSDGPGGA